MPTTYAQPADQPALAVQSAKAAPPAAQTLAVLYDLAITAADLLDLIDFSRRAARYTRRLLTDDCAVLSLWDVDAAAPRRVAGDGEEPKPSV